MNNEEKILEMLNQLQQGQVAMQGDIQGLKQGQEQTNARLDAMQGDITGIKGDVANLKDRVLSIELTQENIIVPKIKAVAEGHGAIMHKLDALDKIEKEQDNHDTRLWALEQAVKK